MNDARKKATKLIIKHLSAFAGKVDTVKETEEMLDAMSDKAFDQYMKDLRDGKAYLRYVAPNLSKTRISVERNLEIGKAMGHKFFNKLWLTDPATGDVYLTPQEYLVVDLPLKRLQQHLLDKISIPKNNSHIDERTGQVTGESKGAGLSFPELQVMYSQGLESSIRELFKFRGGDEKAYRALKKDILETGVASMDTIDVVDTRVKSTEILSVFLKSAHLDNNL